MQGENQNAMQCAEFDALLADALDQTLAPARLQSFQTHAQSCVVCGPLLKEAEAGRQWLKALEPAEPPDYLVDTILLATSGPRRSTRKSAASLWERLYGSFFAPVLAVARQPRFAMSFGMAFFSLSISLSLAGVRLSDVRHVDLRPSAIRRTYYETSGKVVKYYENMRFVYEIESRVREFKRVTAPPEPQPQNNRKKDQKNDTSGQPDQKQERNYSQGDGQPVLAALPSDPPVVWTTTHRRFV